MIRTLILCLCFTAVRLLGQGFDGTSRTGTNIALSPWGIAYGNDSPEGAPYLLDVGNTTATFTITLPSTLAPGVWRFQMKCFDYDRFATATFHLADAVGSKSLSDRDSSRWLEGGLNLTNTVSTNKLVVDLVSSTFIQCRVLAIYWTTNLNEDIDPEGKDLIWNYTYPASLSSVVDSTNNILLNSSFEANLAGWRPTIQNRVTALNDWRVNSGFHGGWAMKIAQASQIVISPYFHVKEDSRAYNLSVYYLGSGTMRIKTAVAAPAGYSNTVNTVLTLGAVTNWTRTNLNVTLINYPRLTPYVIELSGPSNTWFDAIQLTEGTNLLAFRTMGDLEIGWSNAVSGVYYTNEASKPHLIAYNSSGATRAVNIAYEFVNHFNATALSGTVSATLTNGERLEQAITLPNPGWYRALCWAADVPPTESIVIVMPDPTGASFIGTHNYGNVWQMQGMQRLGIGLQRSMSVNAMFRWTIMEPTDNNFSFEDSAVTNATANGASILATIGGHLSGQGIPTYAGTNVSTMNNAQWSNHVYTAVNHFKSWVTNWEIWNEPEAGASPQTAEQYTNVLALASAAIRAADPTARIVGLGGPSDYSFITNVLNRFGAGLSNVVNALSVHGYPEDSDPFSSGPALSQAAGWKSAIVDTYGPGTAHNLPIWNTESGQKDWGAAQNNSRYIVVGGGIYTYSHQRPVFDGLIKAPWQLTQHALAYKAYGFERYYHYDSRVLTINEWLDNHYSSWEGDDGHRPKIAGVAAVNYMVAGTTGAGLLPSPNNNVVFLYFENGNNSRAAAWSTNALNYTLTSTNVVPYDWMLTPKTVAAGQYLIGRMPTYLIPSGGLTSAQFKSALTNSTITPTADTVAPQVNIFLFPGSKITDTNEVLFRWSIVDEVSLSGKNNQSDLLTRSALIANTATITDGAYDPWSTSVQRVFNNVGSEVTLYVQGKDAAGNTNTTTRTFDALSESPGTLASTRLSGKVELKGGVRVQ